MDSIFDDRSSIFSSGSGLSDRGGYNSIAGLEFQNFRANINATTQQARMPGNPNTSFDASQLFNPAAQPSSLVAVTSNQNTPLLTSLDIEPPDLHAIYKFKTDGSYSIKSHIRRGSEAVSSVFRMRIGKNNDADESGSVVSDDTSVRFMNNGNNNNDN
ncbi:unnamed protein product [Ambrosiozyma monospora]|uniref:Unnamed protein product n=1 Tax=Ambrosiozyma monospora TaxID=43982 RepID=A0ACB5TVY8_AMBMO|nr:unnamed protein product [Ambrosiozyma monospora]